jgi:hypothetical protein
LTPFLHGTVPRQGKRAFPEQPRFLWQQGALHDFPHSCRKNRFISDACLALPLPRQRMKAERGQPLSRALATPCLKPASKWFEWHIMQGNKATRTECAKITSADNEHMKGK